MVVIIMEQITSLIEKLRSDSRDMPHLASLEFQPGDKFGWDPTNCLITYAPEFKNAAQLILHEYGHARLGHQSYNQDVKLIEMERAAWDEALLVGKNLDIAIDDDLVEDSLDTYRDWLHDRSTCPNCKATGVQSAKDKYTCLACHNVWRVNEARNCALRRYNIKKRP